MKPVWTDADVEACRKLLAEGLSASQIRKRLGFTRGSVISKVHRTPSLMAEGFKQGRPNPSKIKSARRSYARALPAQNAASKQMPAKVAVPAFQDVTSMAEEWMKRNGGPRRFENGCTTNTDILFAYMRTKGFYCRCVGTGRGMQIQVSGGKAKTRRVSFQAFMAIVDEYRIKDGLEPIALRERAA
jgi:hypothetical protein